MTVGNRLRILGGLVPVRELPQRRVLARPGERDGHGRGLARRCRPEARRQIGATSFVFGGGSPDTFATVQSLGSAAAATAPARWPANCHSPARTSLPPPSGAPSTSWAATTAPPTSPRSWPRPTAPTSRACQPAGARALPRRRRSRRRRVLLRRPDRQRRRQRRDHHGGDPGDRSCDPHRPRRRHAAPGPVRCGRLRDRRPHLRRRRPDRRGPDAHPALRVRRAHPPGRRRRPAAPGRGLRRVRHGRHGEGRHRVPRGRRGGPAVGHRPGRHGDGIAGERDLPAAELLRRTGRRGPPRGRLTRATC